MRLCFLLFCFFLYTLSASAQHAADSMVTQRFVYQSPKAGAVYLVWGVNFWEAPKQQLLPKASRIKGNTAETRMKKDKDGFVAELTLPKGTRIDFLFRVTQDKKNKAIDGWDNNGDNSYFFKIQEPGTITVKGDKLKIYPKPFSLFSWGKKLLLAALSLWAIALFIFRNNLRLRTESLLPAYWLSALILVVLARAEIAQVSYEQPKMYLAAIVQDVDWLLLIALSGSLLLLAFRRRKVLYKTVTALLLFVLLLTVVVALVNIEVVKQLGTPFNYKWLYYSHFLTEADSNKGAAQALTPWYIRHFIFLLSAFVLLGWALHYIMALFTGTATGRLAILGSYLILPVLCLLVNGIYIPPAKKETPVWAFVRSLYEPSGKTKMLKTPLQPSTQDYFLQAASTTTFPLASGTAAIENIIVFVSESTPANMVSIYDSTFNATPHLAQWSRMGRIFNNTYAHIPSTPNSMLSIVTGLYPMVDYKSAVMEGTQLQTPSLPQILAPKGWNTALFFSSDLQYSKMDQFVKSRGFSEVKDFYNLPCKDITGLGRSDLNGLDDSCMVAQYLSWLQTNKGKKNFSVLWTNQTHMPYFASSNLFFTDKNDHLNRYLNALHHTDQIFGALMRSLQQQGMLEHTLVLFIADHGEAFGTHDQKNHGSRIYEENVHIPCVLINPTLFNGERDKAIHGMVDIAPTIAHIAGLAKPAGWQGHSLLGREKRGRTFFVSPYTDLLIGTRSGEWKYIYNVDTRAAELYNLKKDPRELNNVVENYPAVVKNEHELLTGWFQYVHKQYKILQQHKAVSVQKGIMKVQQ